MATPSPKKRSHTGKILIAVAIIFVAGLAWFGYFSQLSDMHSNTTEAAQAEVKKEPLAANDALFSVKPSDLVIGKATAPVTIIEYSSLSCPHCAHFYMEVLPTVRKQLIDTGKAKLVMRYFPLNEPALRASQLVECSGTKREQMTGVLFSLQKNWAYGDNFKDELKKIAAQAGIDSAAFDSCVGDKDSENAILAERQEAATRANVNSTPSFFVNGVLLENFGSPEDFSKAVDAAGKTPVAAAPVAAPAATPVKPAPAAPAAANPQP